MDLDSSVDGDFNERGGTGANLQQMMKDVHMVSRFSKYLNNCLFITNDQFIKRKHQQFVD